MRVQWVYDASTIEYEYEYEYEYKYKKMVCVVDFCLCWCVFLFFKNTSQKLFFNNHVVSNMIIYSVHIIDIIWGYSAHEHVERHQVKCFRLKVE